MPDYKEMYLTMLKASEQAIQFLIEAQQKCEEIYVFSPEPEFKMVLILTENKKSVGKE